MSDSADDFDEQERRALYRVMAARRDMRHFRPDPLADDVLERLLAAPSAARG